MKYFAPLTISAISDLTIVFLSRKTILEKIPADGFPFEEENDGKDAKNQNGDSGDRPWYHIFQVHTMEGSKDHRTKGSKDQRIKGPKDQRIRKSKGSNENDDSGDSQVITYFNSIVFECFESGAGPLLWFFCFKMVEILLT